MQDDGDERRKVKKKKILFPETRPWEIEKQGPHFEANDDQQCAQNAVHSKMEPQNS